MSREKIALLDLKPVKRIGACFAGVYLPMMLEMCIIVMYYLAMLRAGGGMADAVDLCHLSTGVGNSLCKFGQTRGNLST